MKKTILYILSITVLTGNAFSQSVIEPNETVLPIIERYNTEAPYVEKRENFSFNAADTSWILNSVVLHGYDGDPTNERIPKPNIIANQFVASGSSDFRYIVEGDSPNVVITYAGVSATNEFNSATYQYFNTAGTIDSILTVSFLPNGDKLVLNRSIIEEDGNSRVTIQYSFASLTQSYVLSRTDSTITVAPDSTIRAIFDADGDVLGNITINSRRTDGDVIKTITYQAVLPDGAVFNSAGPFTYFTTQQYSITNTTTGINITETYTRSREDALAGTPFAFKNRSVNTPTSQTSTWDRESLMYRINLATNDTTLIDAIVNTTESFGTASRRFVNYGTENAYVSLESVLYQNVSANRDSSLFVNRSPDGSIIGGQYSIIYRTAQLPSSIQGVGFPAIPTSIEFDTETTPQVIALDQNFPNPFNPSTTIGFSLPQNEMVRLAIYDVLGREVAVLLNQAMPAGAHQVQFDASMLSSGHYLYRISTPTATITRSMTLIK
ncbi:MAG: T9SS type A sorting domain-containing protein [Bacteroidetes bacterium]|nr:T9SS type A sorting domain-containing protein [Bacteroidota bacterium]